VRGAQTPTFGTVFSWREVALALRGWLAAVAVAGCKCAMAGGSLVAAGCGRAKGNLCFDGWLCYSFVQGWGKEYAPRPLDPHEGVELHLLQGAYCA
jgi:hypothetical protein